MDKIISFIIPSYNVEQYLEKCLSSFLNPQAIEQMEVIIVDDGSKDRTARIAEDYVKQYPELFRLISKENGGHGSAINAGTAAAVGRYLKVIDADDWVVTENLKGACRQAGSMHSGRRFKSISPGRYEDRRKNGLENVPGPV